MGKARHFNNLVKHPTGWFESCRARQPIKGDNSCRAAPFFNGGSSFVAQESWLWHMTEATRGGHANPGYQKLSFVVDGLRLYGCLHLPEESPQALIVGVHGLMADKNSPKQIALARQLPLQKMAYFRFDHRGGGESEGDFNDQTTLENRCRDILAAVQAAKQPLGAAVPLGLFGSSLGGTVCLATAKMIDPFAIVTLAAPVKSRAIQLPAQAPASLKRELKASRLTFNIAEQIETVHHLLILHGGADETVPVENAHLIYRSVQSPKKKIILRNGDHRISAPSLQQQVAEATVRWFIDCCREQLSSPKSGVQY